MKQIITVAMLCSLFTCGSLVSCKSANRSRMKDIGGSPANARQSAYVVFLTPADSKVHKAECPSMTSPINRSCPGVKDLSQLSKEDYESGLRKAILAQRPGGVPSTSTNTDLVKTLEDKITRINAKLSTGELSDADKASLQSQLAELNRELIVANGPALNSDEQKRFDLIMQKLNASNDVTFDEGEVNYNLAIAAFGGGDASAGMAFVKIPAGKFVMGSPSTEAGRNPDEVQHQVTISKDFELQTTEVTQSQWVAVMGSNPSFFRRRDFCPQEFKTSNNISLCPNNPVENVSWYDAQEFISKLNAKGYGYRYRLPTEAEWEYAARAGSTDATAGILDDMAWYEQNSRGLPHPVAKKKPNAWGLYDMHGNVFEWTADRYDPYTVYPVTDPVGPSTGSLRINRGGSWKYPEKGCRSAYRNNYPPESRLDFLGLRLVRAQP